MNLTAAEAWCWAAWMLGREADGHTYRWPREEGDLEAAAELEDHANACWDRAHSLDQSEDLWKRAMAKWDRACAGLVREEA